jgi:adenosylcobinamide-GDP ribazoletransferase
MSNLWLAFSFLTTLPLGRLSSVRGQLGKAALWFPLVGGVLGGMLIAFECGFGQILLFPKLVTAILVLAAWAWLTGGLHLDGVADCGDGLLAAASAERRLEIMQDPRLGAFGGIALFFFLLLKIAAFYALDDTWLAILMAAVLSRWVIVPMAFIYPSAREHGMAATLHRELVPMAWKVTLIYPIVLIGIGGWPTVVVVTAVAGAAWCMAHFATRRIGGLTGDVYGLLIEGTEIVVLLTHLALTAHNLWI